MFKVTHILSSVAFIVLAASPLRAQGAAQRVIMTGQVSGVAAAALGSTGRLADANVQVSSSSSGGGLVISFAGSRGGETSFDLPIQLCSNTEFTLNASGAGRRTRLACRAEARTVGTSREGLTNGL